MNVMRTQTHSTSPSDLGTQRDFSHRHVPVLLHEVIDGLHIKKDDVVIDGTLGMGGHAREILTLLDKRGVFIGIDQDGDVLAQTESELRTRAQAKIIAERLSFEHIPSVLIKHHLSSEDKVLLDLGWGSHTLESKRGFSFMKDEPLVMTYASTVTEETLTAYDIVNTWSKDSLESIIRGWGEERHARRISEAIVAEREKSPIKTTQALASLIERVVKRHGKTHPATQTFQALRIAVNDELGALERTLDAVTQLLSVGGRLAIITFHSIEDRLVKQYFKRIGDGVHFELITKKAIQPSREELKVNPRSRSAKLRIISKIQ